MNHHGQTRREQILQVSEEMFARHGFINTNLDLVAERLSVKRQAIYYYFKTKDAILVELVNRGGSALRDAGMPTLLSDLPPREKLARVVANHVEHVLNHSVTFQVQFAEVRRMAPESIEEVRRGEETYVRLVADLLQEGQDAGEFTSGDVVPTALMILGMCNSTLEWYQPSRHMSISDVAALAVKIVMDGLVVPSVQTVPAD